MSSPRDDVRVFADAVGAPLTVWQADGLALDTTVTVIVAGRQLGKSRSCAVLALWWAFRHPEELVLIVSAGEAGSRRLLAEVRRLASGSDLLRGSVVDEQAGLVRLANGAEVRAVPASERAIRGWSASLLIVDEAGSPSADVLLGAALPTITARPHARVVMADSAWAATGPFYDLAVQGEQGAEHVTTHRWVARAAGGLADAPWVSPTTIELFRASMSDLRFRAEVLGEFVSSADGLFTREGLRLATADFLPDRLDSMQGPGRVLAGVDWALRHDRSALVAVGRLVVDGDPVFAVRCAHAWPQATPGHEVVGDIASSPAHFDTLAPERNGVGDALSEMLWRVLDDRPKAQGGGVRRRGAVLDPYQLDDLLRGVERRGYGPPGLRPESGFATKRRPIVTTADLKAATFTSMKVLLERGALVLPADAQELQRELLSLRVELGAHGERVDGASGQHTGDLAMAFCLALHPFKTRRGRWLNTVAALCDGRPLPKPIAPAADDTTVTTGAGRQLPRRPTWQSPNGSEVTYPEGVPRPRKRPGPPVIREAKEAHT